ncbi:MAG: alpha/beta hydrolase-fold protein [Bacteroidales bacterium]
MKALRNLLLAGLILSGTNLLHAATVDSLEVASKAMNRTYKAAVVLPDAYAQNKAFYPVLYLLHGGSGHFSDWLSLPPNKNVVKELADRYKLIVVMPEGEEFGWYMDSPTDPGSRFETHIIREVIPAVDAAYRTVATKKGRVITGLSMGGHGAMYLATRNPDMFSAVGTMSGAMDMDYTKFLINPEFTQSLKDRFEALLGTSDPDSEIFRANSVMHMTDQIKANGLPVLIDCGYGDFLIGVNRELHNRLLYNGTPHTYIERPGGHTWDYWENALPYHVLFFHKVLLANGVTVE